MLTGLQTVKLPVLLQSLQLCKLERVQLLAAKHLRWSHNDLPLRKLDELRLAWVLERADGANGLIHGSSHAVTRLKTATLLSKASGCILLLILALVLVVRLTPIAVKISRRRASVAGLTASPLVIRLTTSGSVTRLRELETACASSRERSTVVPNGHRLAPSVGTCSDVTSPLQAKPLRRLGRT